MHKQQYMDTSAWILQVWASFFLAVSSMLFGLYHMPAELWIKGYLVMGLFFTIGSTFTLAKTIRDNRHEQSDTSAWILQVWLAFAIAVFLMGVGIYFLPVDRWIRGFAGIGSLFVLASSFTLAKTIRDNYELTKDHAPPRLSLDHEEPVEMRLAI